MVGDAINRPRDAHDLPVHKQARRGVFRAELLAFVELASGRGKSRCTARDGLEAMRIAEAAARSLREGRTVRIAEINTSGEKEVSSEVISR